ncbi:helix-turn-helix domain-containing protein [Phaeovulum sp.]|uniref:helix-turn-helix domain-containing protein n=1 Tax=Phaeovulum sp. TaxID=2934796 RepID=UPI0039E5ADFE
MNMTNVDTRICPQDDGKVHDIGQRLRLRRKLRGLSLKDVSGRARVSIGLLSQVERGLTMPSVNSMTAICAALEMPVSWLFDAMHATAAEDADIVVRRSNRRELTYDGGRLRKELLTPDSQPEIQMLRFIMQPGGSCGEPYNSPQGGKCGVVLRGTLGLELDDRSFQIEAGDSFAFPATAMTRFWTIGEEVCEVFWIVAPATL